MSRMKGMVPINRGGSVFSILKQVDGVDMWLMLMGIVGAVGDGFAMPALTLLTAKFMNNIGTAPFSTTDNFTSNIQKNALVMCWVALGQWVACFLEGYCWTRTAERQASRLRARYLKAVLRQEVGYFDLNANSTAEIITTVSGDIFLIQDVIAEKVPVFFMNIATLVGGYLVAFILLWRLAIVAFPFVLLLVVPGLMYGRVLMGIARKMREEYKKADVVAQQAISCVRTVYSCVGEEKATASYSAALERTTRLGLKQGLAKGLAIGSNGVTFSIWAFVYYYGSKMVMYHGAQGGTVFAVGAAMAIGGLSLGTALSNLKSFSEASAAIERIMEMITRVPEIDSENNQGVVPGDICGEVEFKHVNFAYPSRPETTIFKDLNLKIQSGRMVALVGESGSGKSTVISLLHRFYDPLSGEILLDGVPISKLQIKWLRSQMGLISQEPALFATTIKENILFGKEDADMEQVIAAAKISNAHDFISKLPQQYDTQVGERGVQVSGGQKQRIAIARAVIKEPRILLLDEATSALDSQSEHIVQQALDMAAMGRTTIIVAHRLSTVCHADLIAVFRNGHVVETGSHDELIHHENGLYSSLVQLQQTQKQGERIDPSFKSDLQEDVNNTSSQTTEPAATSHVVENKATTAPTQNVTHKAPSFRRLLQINPPEWKHATVGCIGAVLFGAVQPVYSFLAGTMISVYFMTDHNEIKKETKIYASVFIGFSLFSFTVNIIQHYNFGYIGEMLAKRVRERMLSKMLTFEVGWFDKDVNSSGAMCSRLAKDSIVVRSLVGDRMALLVQAASAVTVAFTMGLVISWRLSIVIIAVQPLTVLCFYFKRVLLKNMSNKVIKSQNDSSKLAAESITNLRTVVAFSSQARILTLLEKAQQGPHRESIRQSWFAGIVLGTSQCLMALSWALDFWYGGKLIAHGYIRPKAFFETFLVLINTGRIIGDAGTMTNDIAKGSDAVSSVFDVLDRCTKIEPADKNGYAADKLIGHVEICDVEFAYPARLDIIIFDGFSIKIEAGKSTALVGSSGSGKSTVISLIERFYDPIRGVVKIDGRDIRSYNLRSLRQHIALVSQEPTLFTGTIRENIAYSVFDSINELQIIEAAKAANAHEFISCLKDGYDTICGDGGSQFSGGQKQRIAITRALLKNPAILLLDEATSALDSQSEKVVLEAIERVMAHRTSVVVAHRLSTIQNCDTIALLEKGKVLEKGTHSSLLAKMGSYYSLVTLQRTSRTIDTFNKLDQGALE